MTVNQMRLPLGVVLAVNLLAACSITQQDRYQQKHDSAPDFSHHTPILPDAEPKYEPYRAVNSRSYTVMGKHYFPLSTGKGYEAIGYASWYGQKFHGHATSSGEPYDMFAMTAAHKTLPLPSYVKVTNLENGLTAIVRVNDRGPFHDNRVIDLSYSAAHKLGYLKNGTAKVKLEVIHVDINEQVTVGKDPTIPYAVYANGGNPLTNTGPNETVYIQVAAVSNVEKAKSVSSVLSSLYQVPSHIPFVNNVYRLQLGPLTDPFQIKSLLEELKRNGYPGAYTIRSQDTAID